MPPLPVLYVVHVHVRIRLNIILTADNKQISTKVLINCACPPMRRHAETISSASVETLLFQFLRESRKHVLLSIAALNCTHVRETNG